MKEFIKMQYRYCLNSGREKTKLIQSIRIVMLLCFSLCLLTACIPLHQKNEVPDIANQLPPSIKKTQEELLIIPTLYQNIVTGSQSRRTFFTGKPIITRAENLGIISKKLSSSTFGIFTFIGTVYGRERHIQEVCIIGKNRHAVSLRSPSGYRANNKWRKIVEGLISPSWKNKLIKTVSEKSNMSQLYDPEDHICSFNHGKSILDWSKDIRKKVLTFLIKLD